MKETALAPTANGNGHNLHPAEELWNSQQMAVIKSTIAKNATDTEFFLFAQLCRKYNLDPFNKEVWFIKYGSDPLIMTSRDGYLKICLSQPDFKGISSAAVREGDDFEMNPASGELTHRFGKERGAIIGAWAMAKHARRDPVICFADFSEYDKSKERGGDTWKKYPSAMICKVAEVMALKRQGGITGLVTTEEMGDREHLPIPETHAAPAGDPSRFLPDEIKSDEEKIAALKSERIALRAALGLKANDAYLSWLTQNGLPTKPETWEAHEAIIQALRAAAEERARLDAEEAEEEATDAEYTPDPDTQPILALDTDAPAARSTQHLGAVR